MPRETSSDDAPERRRVDDMPLQNVELILYQLGELKADIREFREEMKARLDRVETRLVALERFRERTEERDRAEAAQASTVNARWVPVSIALLSVIVTVLLFVAGAK